MLKGVFVESINDFTVNARAIAPLGQGRVKALLTDPEGGRVEVPVTSNKDGTYTGTYTPFDKGHMQHLFLNSVFLLFFHFS